MKILTTLFLVFYIAHSPVFGTGCSLPSTTENDEKMPVLVDNSTSEYRLITPTNGNVILDKNEKIIVLCPNSKNILVLTNTNTSIISCVEGQTVKVLKNNVQFSDISCKSGIRGTAESTNIDCGNGSGRIIKIGFPIEKDFLALIEVCYDSENGNALYSAHQITGKEIDYASRSTSRPSFSVAELGPGVSANVAYKKTYEKATFNTLLGSAKLAAKYINTTSYLARGHLSPDADFLYTSWQFATYFYVNTAPQWQAVNNGNWKRLENLGRFTASYYQENFTIYTGGHEILQLPNSRNQNVNMYLVAATRKLAVPKFLWKILYSRKTKKAIAFVALNNPFIEDSDKPEDLCGNICDDYGWGNEAWSKGAKGLVHCCDARDLLQVLSAGPEGLDIRGVLSGPQTALAKLRWFNEDY